MKAAGVNMLWGIEYDDEIAQVARDNGLPTRTADMLQVDPSTLPAVDCLHMSPPCPNFSVAKTGASETEADLALARQCAAFVEVLCPEIVTLENVWGYRRSESWAIIRRALTRAGYQWNAWHLCAADYGVPQTRKRMIVVAVLGGPRPTRPPATHAQNPPPPGLFGDVLEPWAGWYEAIKDILHTLPDSQFADWQLKRLPDEVRTMLVSNAKTEWGDGIHEADAPALTVSQQHAGRRRAMLVTQDYDAPTSTVGRSPQRREGDKPANSVRASPANALNLRALIVGAGGRRGDVARRDGETPMLTLTSNNNQSHQLRALVVGGTADANGTAITWIKEEEPFLSVAASHYKHAQRASVGPRVVQMTPRALARFQSFPDRYVLPESKRLACKGIGNAVPPLMQQRLYEHLLRS